ncbi:type IV pilus twitching motility protein PilT [Alicyclobacillus tolerans]|uniref:Twitching motility protein PilT n=2 Tax=Alicyclobacillus tolerans TaxID=90970 RepID=A0A1M6XJ24_9BACL|nr:MULTISPECIES: PilT/PilU family type 4a pilus ATPase [Alicyclobacillus]MDP9728785.1 twitching motility protein PilT [Alicyclobacillus tengchongensis]SHL05913.1 twitching motility protein PilT [Alicyclobacillus montanus]
MNILELLEKAVLHNASDIHLSVGSPPILRIQGMLVAIERELESDDIRSFAKLIMTEEQLAKLQKEKNIDMLYSLHDKFRYRINAYIQREQLSLAIRIVPSQIPSLSEMNMPKIFLHLCQLSHGLVIVTGPTGSGKSTTLAAMIQHINQTQKKKIITLEDPIEFLYSHMGCLIEQREIGRDTNSYADGLRSALRQDPDILLLGEMRDIETMATAITAAETGHLVFTTLHTPDATSAVERIIDVFPAIQQQQIRVQLANILQAVIAQKLFRGPDKQRVAAYEILIGNTAVANLIRQEKVHQIRSIMQTSREEGMQTMEMHIRELLEKQQIFFEADRVAMTTFGKLFKDRPL